MTQSNFHCEQCGGDCETLLHSIQAALAKPNFRRPKCVYQLTRKDESTFEISLEAFRERFPKAGSNFLDRLMQFREMFPNDKIVDWTMIDIGGQQ